MAPETLPTMTANQVMVLLLMLAAAASHSLFFRACMVLLSYAATLSQCSCTGRWTDFLDVSDY